MKKVVSILSVLLVLLLITGTSNAQSMQYEGKTINDVDAEGKKTGPWVIFAKMRNVRGYNPEDKYEAGDYATNRKTGVWTRYYPSGKTLSEITFKNGRPAGEFTTYHKNGVVEEKGTQSGRKTTGSFERFYEDGTIQRKANFGNNGKSTGKQEYYHPNGQVELAFETNDGIETGTATRYYTNGDVKEVLTYGEGGVVASRDPREMVNPEVKIEKKEGKSSVEFKGGGVNEGGTEKTVYKIEDGQRKVYNANKDIWMDGEFKNNRLWNGKLYVYDSDGLLEKIEMYKSGKHAGAGVMN